MTTLANELFNMGNTIRIVLDTHFELLKPVVIQKLKEHANLLPIYSSSIKISHIYFDTRKGG